MPSLYVEYNPISSRKEAMKMEILLAESLKKRGYTVWQK